MTEAGRAVIAEQGVSTLDNAAEPCTPLVNNRECAYVAWTPDGTALCAIEQAFRDGKTDFMKPVSCHLYPIRVDEYGEFTAVNYHQWDVCRCAVAKGDSTSASRLSAALDRTGTTSCSKPSPPSRDSPNLYEGPILIPYFSHLFPIVFPFRREK